MFEIGKTYTVVTLQLTDNGYDKESIAKTVAAIDGNLVRFESGEILNVTSPLFHSATDEILRKEYFDKMDKDFDASSNG